MTRMTATDEDATKLTTAITKISAEATVQTNASLTRDCSLLTLTGIVVIVNNFTTNDSGFIGYQSNTEPRTYKLRLLTHLIHIGKKCKGFPYSIPMVGPGADPGVQAVSRG